MMGKNKKEEKKNTALYQKNIDKELSSGVSLQEAERKAKLEQQQRLAIRGAAKAAAAYITKDPKMIKDITPAEKKAVKGEVKKRMVQPMTHPWRSISLSQKRKDRKLVKKVGKEAGKQIAKKAAKKAVMAAIKPFLPFIIIFLFIITIIFIVFPALAYYICEGGGIGSIPWLLRLTPLGSLCG